MKMSVCCVCGYKGRSRIKERLIYCVQCKFNVSAVHRYCKPTQADETAGWTCEDCLDEKMMRLREESRKSSRVQERSIKKSINKAIHNPKRAEIRGSVFDSSHSEVQLSIQSTKGSLKDTCDHLQRLEQRKVCFICGFESNITDLIDCVQCNFRSIHSRCRLSQEHESLDWTCDHCIDKKMMQLIQPSKQIMQTSKMRAGRMPKKQHGDRRQNKALYDTLFRKERVVGLPRKSNHDRPSNKVIKVQTPNLQSTSSPHDGIHMENRQREKLIMDHEDTCDDEDHGLRTAANKAAQGLLQNAQNCHRKVEQKNETSSNENGGQIEVQPLEPVDQSIKGARHDATGIKRVPAKMPLYNVLAEPIMTPMWQGKFLIEFGNNRADMELVCYLSTKSSSKVTEAVKVLPSTITFAVKCRSDIWPRRFHMPTLNDKAIAVYFLPMNDKAEQVYNKILDYEIKHDLALFYEMPATNQNLLIFPSVLLPVRSCSKYT
ncbi:hypothetical protein QQ045_020629 [Rhodiola kirilowii]